jgi:hypothetical protein
VTPGKGAGISVGVGPWAQLPGYKPTAHLPVLYRQQYTKMPTNNKSSWKRDVESGRYFHKHSDGRVTWLMKMMMDVESVRVPIILMKGVTSGKSICEKHWLRCKKEPKGRDWNL